MKKPHILIFNPDQWRGDVLHHMGNPAAVTPSLDALAREGVSFRNAFCQNPVCTPSRCSFMTGWYPHVRGHRTMTHMLQPDEPCLLKILKDDGYFVWWGGKNDLVPGQHSLGAYCDVRFQPTPGDYARWGCKPTTNPHAAPHGEPDGGYYSFYIGKTGADGEAGCFDSDWGMVFGAIDFIRNAPKDKPLCIYLPLRYPHPPYGVEDPWYGAIDRSKLPPRISTPGTGKPMMLGKIREGQQMQGWTEDRWTELRATYYGMCARVDHQFGMVAQALRDAGFYDDTALFVFSDHGDFTGDYGLVEKTQNTFEDCLTNVPFLVKPPKETPVKPGVSDALVELTDFPATVYDLAGITPGYTHFGRSLLPLMAGQAAAHRDAVFCEGGRLEGEDHCSESVFLEIAARYRPRLKWQAASHVAHGKAVMCRTMRFKYVRRLYESDEFYDLAADPGETQNKINDPAHASDISACRDRLLTFFLETGDTVPFTIDKR